MGYWFVVPFVILGCLAICFVPFAIAWKTSVRIDAIAQRVEADNRRVADAAREANERYQEETSGGNTSPRPESNQNTSQDPPRANSEEARKEYLNNLIQSKLVVNTCVVRIDTDLQNDAEKKNIALDEHDTPPSCAICLVDYEVGDVVGYSHNSRCNHAFHRSCILSWLEKHDECPCCRNSYYLGRKRDKAIDNDVENFLERTISRQISRGEMEDSLLADISAILSGDLWGRE